MNGDTVEESGTWHYKQWRAELWRVALFYIAALAVVYSSVVFFGYTLHGAAYGTYGVTGDAAHDSFGRRPADTYNLARAPSYYQEPPYNHLIGKMYLEGKLPLWNPYQASGQPLAGMYATRAFFPYQIIENISPAETKDLFTLGRLLIAGIFTFLFLRMLAISRIASLMGGLFYMFSGAFLWFLEHEEVVNPAMMLPVFMLAVEAVVSNRRPIFFFTFSLVTGLLMVAGQPESALYILLLGGLYALFRVWMLHRISWHGLITTIKVGGAFALGLGLAAPLIFIFLELVGNGWNIHPAGGGMGVSDPTPLSWAIGYIVPNFFDTPTPERVVPVNGVWEYLGGHIGVLMPLLAVAGVFFRGRERPFLLFFGAVGLWIVLKNLGFAPFIWLGRLPLFDQAWSNVWAGATWNFCFAMAGATGFGLLQRNIELNDKSWIHQFAIHPKRFIFVIIFILSAMTTLAYLMVPDLTNGGLTRLLCPDWAWKAYQNITPLPRFALTLPYDKNFFAPSVLAGLLVVLLVVMMAWLMLAVRPSKKGWSYAFIALAMVELWFHVPRGYDYQFLYLKLIPVALGLGVVWFLLWERWRTAVILAVVAIVAIAGIDVASPQGFPKRSDPYQPAPYVQFLQAQAGLSRIMGTDGMLMPNNAQVFGLYDVRFENWVNVTWYHHYTSLLKGLPLWKVGTSIVSSSTSDTCQIFFTGTPPLIYVPTTETFAPIVRSQLPYYSFLGVKYIVTPGTVSMDDLPLAYSDEAVNVYENPQAFPRAFVAHEVDYEPSFPVAHLVMGLDDLSPGDPVTLEEKAPAWFGNSIPNKVSSATITDYQPDRVEIVVEGKAPGLLVLTDTYYPGWEARVDGEPAKIYRVNGVVRGVFIEAGKHRVVFSYFPESFQFGAKVAVVSAIILLLLVLAPVLWRPLVSFITGRGRT